MGLVVRALACLALLVVAGCELDGARVPTSGAAASAPPAPRTVDTNACVWAFNGQCDDSRHVGAASSGCPHRTDATDCQALPMRSVPELAGNTCQWAFDGECDDMRHVGADTGVCRPGTDQADCSGLQPRGRQDLAGNTCQWAFDGECDHRGIGTGVCPEGTDMADCSQLDRADGFSYGALACAAGGGNCGVWGAAIGYPTPRAAQVAALQECGTRDCGLATTFSRGGCVAVATAPNGGHGWALNAGNLSAGTGARDVCGQRGGRNCTVAVRGCVAPCGGTGPGPGTCDTSDMLGARERSPR